MIKKILNPEKILVFAGMVVAVLICRALRVPCLYRELLGFPCPTCGMTRAYFALLRLDFKAAFAYHPLFWAVPILLLFFWFDGKVFSQKYLNIAVFSAVLSLFFIRWLWILI